MGNELQYKKEMTEKRISKYQVFLLDTLFFTINVSTNKEKPQQKAHGHK